MAAEGRPARVAGNNGGSMVGVLYVLTVIGAAVYFIQAADGFWAGVGGLLKALVWPAFVIHRALELLGL